MAPGLQLMIVSAMLDLPSLSYSLRHSLKFPNSISRMIAFCLQAKLAVD